MPFDYRHFIRKYNLNGLIEDVRWRYHDGVLRVMEMTPDRKVMVDITAPCLDYPDETETVVTGGKDLCNKLLPLDMPVALSIEKGDWTKLIFEDAGATVEYFPRIDQADLKPVTHLREMPKMEYNRTLLTRNCMAVLNKHKIRKRHAFFRFSPGNFSFNGYHLLQALKANIECQTFNLKTSSQGLAIATFFCPSGWLARYYFIRWPVVV